MVVGFLRGNKKGEVLLCNPPPLSFGSLFACVAPLWHPNLGSQWHILWPLLSQAIA